MNPKQKWKEHADEIANTESICCGWRQDHLANLVTVLYATQFRVQKMPQSATTVKEWLAWNAKMKAHATLAVEPIWMNTRTNIYHSMKEMRAKRAKDHIDEIDVVRYILKGLVWMGYQPVLIENLQNLKPRGR